MYYRSLLLILIALLSLSSCEEECNASNLNNVIIGTWDVFNGPNFVGEVSFESNGELIDPNHVFFGGFVNGLSFQNKVFEIFDNQFIVITVLSDSGLSFFEQELDAFSFDCEFIESDMDLTIPLSFERVSF